VEIQPQQEFAQIPSPDSTTFVIEHNEPRFHLERIHVFGGNSDAFSIDLTTEGTFIELNHGGFEIRASLCWEGETLVFDSKLHRAGEQATNIVRYKLTDAGQSFIAEERFRSNEHDYENTWVFDKQ
jgi:hypothetical protein